MYLKSWTSRYRRNKHKKELAKVRRTKELHEKEWLEVEGVIAVGIGTDNDSSVIVVSYSGNANSIKGIIPQEIEEIPVIFRYSGEIRAEKL